MTGIFVGLWSAFVIVALVACSKPEPPPPVLGPDVPATAMAEPAPQAEHREPAVRQEPGKWYDGGTLSGSNGLDWQKATPENKLATCADILAKLWTEKNLKPEIAAKLESVDDLKPLAVELVAGLDKAFAGSREPKENQRMLANQTVASASIALLMMMGWLQRS